MPKKRRLESESTVHKQSPVEVITEDLSSHPLCIHGPTLLFSGERGRYFACSSCRNKKDCTLHIGEEDWAKESVKERNEKYKKLIPKIDKPAAWRNFSEVKSRHSTDRAYCNTCQELYIYSQSKKHLKDKEHRVITPLTDDQLKHPTSWLPTLENDSVEAQYMFSRKSVSAVLGILKNNNIKNIICIGAPSVHYTVQSQGNFNSILLDYDTRHQLFNPPNKYLWYNMFNDYLFCGNNDEKILRKFIKNSKDDGICIVMDPPFGGRVEPLVHTIKELSSSYNILCEKTEEIMPVIWAFPYFSEPYITGLMPTVKMHDFQVEYENHKKFQNGKKGRKNGSPVRFFTNLPFSSIDLSNDSSYKLCDKCKFWVSVTNKHCTKCQACTSKNGMTYRHCNVCKRCVKPTFFHCKECGRCCQEKGHVCGIEVESQSCYNCNEKGHKQTECPQKEGQLIKKKKRKNA